MFRILLGVLLLVDLGIRVLDLGTHYTDWGVLPRASLLEHTIEPEQWSLHLMSGSWFFQALLFALHFLATLAFTLGLQTRRATFFTWLLTASLHTRNPFVLYGHDTLIRALLFWSIFLPLGARFSLDRRANPPGPEPESNSLCSAATAALLLQVASLYLYSVLLKNHPYWHEGKAVTMALRIDQFLNPIGTYFRDWFELHRVLTYLTLAWETLGPILAFSPWANAPLRCLVVAGMVTMHLGFGTFLYIGLFPLTSMVGWVPFLPDSFWQRFGPRLPRPSLPGWVQDLPRSFGSEAPGPMRLSWRQTLVVGIFFVYVHAWNLRTTDFDRFEPYFPRSWNGFGNFFRVEQYWAMFAPFPMLDDGWYVFPGELADGTKVDAWSGKPPDKSKPERVTDFFPNHRWHKYLRAIYMQKNAEQRLPFGKWVCRSWESRHPGRAPLKSFQFLYIEETTQPDFEEGPEKEILLWDHRCY